MTIKLVTLNVWQGGNLLPGILEFLAAEKPDIVALQEVYDGRDPTLPDRYRTMAVLRQELAYPYDDFAQAFIDDSQEGMLPQGNAILSKFPVRNRQAVFLVDPVRDSYQHIPENFPLFPRVMQHIELETPAGIANIFNIHGVWDLNGDNASQARQGMVDKLIASSKGLPHVMLTGDTNAKATNPAMRRLEDSLVNAYKPDLTTTFNMRRKSNPGYATAAVDHLYVSKDVRVFKAHCPDVDISDHLPLVTTLDLE